MDSNAIVRISASHLFKKFDLDVEIRDSALAQMVALFSRNRVKRELQALTDISFEVKAGEILGVLGRNGSGKSTLLRVLAEVYLPDSGEVKINGKVHYLSGLGQGLMPKLTMRENIYLIGALRGLSQEETKEKFDEIVAFSGCEEFVDARVYQFSSGMKSRLVFSATIHCVHHRYPDILLVDEVLGTSGDIEFQTKAVAKIEELIRGGAAVVMVSHNMDHIEKYCHQAIWLDKGKMVNAGTPREVVERYVASAKIKKKAPPASPRL